MTATSAIRRALGPLGGQTEDDRRRAETALAAAVAANNTPPPAAAPETVASVMLDHGLAALASVRSQVPVAQSDDKKDDKKEKDEDDEEDEDEDKDDDDGDRAANRSSRMSASRKAERGRIEAIMGSAAGVANPQAASRIALRTSLPREEAIALVESIGPVPRNATSLADRMARADTPHAGPGTESPRGGNQNWSAEAILAAAKKARGDK